MLEFISTLDTVESDDDDARTLEHRLSELREQAAVVRTMADHVDHFAQPGNSDGFREQLIEEVTRLGCHLLEAAAAMTRKSPSDYRMIVRRFRISPLVAPVVAREGPDAVEVIERELFLRDNPGALVGRHNRLLGTVEDAQDPGSPPAA